MVNEKKIDETIPGGRYIVGDKYVDANGNAIGTVEAREGAAKRNENETDGQKTDQKETKNKKG